MLEIRTLGHSAVRLNGDELAGVTSLKQRFAILVYLAVEGRVARDRLLAIFWPDREEERARHSLSQALYALRRDLHEECVQVEGDVISIVDTACAVDVKKIEEAADTERWQDVVGMYGGPFLADFTLSGAPEFEKWQSSTRTRLARVARNAFRRVVEARVEAGDQAGALSAASQWATLDPLEDEAQHTLITLLARSGNRTAAIKQYETYRELLAKELEVEPLEGTKALVARVRNGEIPEFRPLGTAEQPANVHERAAAYVEAADAPPPPQHLTMASLMSELRKRRVFHVGAAYLAVAWLATQFTGTLVEHAILPSLVFRIVLLFLFVGFPFTVILAWAQEPSRPSADREPRRLWPQWAERVRGGQLFWFLGALVLALGAGWLVLEQGLAGARPLDTSAIVVFPLAVIPEGNDDVGENLATLVGTSLENTGEFRYVDGWYSVDKLAAGVQDLSDRTATSRTRSLGAAYYIRGRVRLSTDSASTAVELHSVADNAVVVRAMTSGSTEDGWVRRDSREIARQLLAAFQSPAQPIELTLASDSPQAVDQFLEGERAYRRAQFAAALEHYGQAVRLDSSFHYAALKGFLAASWERDTAAAGRFYRVATRQPAFLEPSRAQFAQGIGAYWEGRADEALDHLSRAVAIAPNWPEARAQLGELYYHFLPGESPLDSLAEAAFEEVRRLEADFGPVLYHLIQLKVLRGDVEEAEGLLQDYARLAPDTSRELPASVKLTVDCVSRTPDVIDWRAAVKANPAAVFVAGQTLAVGGRQAECARAAWAALLEHDSLADDTAYYRHLWALTGLQSLLVAEGRYDDVRALLDADSVWDYLEGDLYILDAVAGADLASEAEAGAAEIGRRIRDGTANSADLWLLGVWEAYQGRTAEALAIADTLRFIAGAESIRAADLMGRSVEARAVLAAGDSTRALELLRQLHPSKRWVDPWYMWESLAFEDLALARLLFTRGEYEGALRIAANFDAPARPATDLPYLPASLALRVRLAQKLGDRELERRSLARLSELGRSDLLEGLKN